MVPSSVSEPAPANLKSVDDVISPDAVTAPELKVIAVAAVTFALKSILSPAEPVIVLMLTALAN